MFGSLGVPELIFIFALALLIFGPRKLPQIGRTIGRGLAEFRKASTELKRSLNTEMIEEEMRESDPRRILRDDPAPPRPASPAAAGPGDQSAPADRAPADDDPADDDPADDDPADDTPADDAAPAGSVPRTATGEAP